MCCQLMWMATDAAAAAVETDHPRCQLHTTQNSINASEINA